MYIIFSPKLMFYFLYTIASKKHRSTQQQDCYYVYIHIHRQILKQEWQWFVSFKEKQCTMQFYTGISRNTWSKSYMSSLTECVWEFQNSALWDTH